MRRMVARNAAYVMQPLRLLHSLRFLHKFFKYYRSKSTRQLFL